MGCRDNIFSLVVKFAVIALVVIVLAAISFCAVKNEKLCAERVQKEQKMKESNGLILKHVADEADSLKMVLSKIEEQNVEMQCAAKKQLSQDSINGNELKEIKKEVKRLRVSKK